MAFNKYEVTEFDKKIYQVENRIRRQEGIVLLEELQGTDWTEVENENRVLPYINLFFLNNFVKSYLVLHYYYIIKGNFTLSGLRSGFFKRFRSFFFSFLGKEKKIFCTFLQTKSNIFITLSDFFSGNVLFTFTSGRLKSSRNKREIFASSNCVILGSLVGSKIINDLKISSIFICLKIKKYFFNSLFKSFLRGLISSGLFIKIFFFKVYRSHNGCRLRKKRRL